MSNIKYLITLDMKDTLLDFLNRIDKATVEEIFSGRYEEEVFGQASKARMDFIQAKSMMSFDDIYNGVVDLRRIIENEAKELPVRIDNKRLFEFFVSEELHRRILVLFFALSAVTITQILIGSLGNSEGAPKFTAAEIDIKVMALFGFFESTVLPYGFCLK